MIKGITINLNINEVDNLLMALRWVKDYHKNPFLDSALKKLRDAETRTMGRYHDEKFNAEIEAYQNRNK